MSEIERRRISRREFLKLSLVGAGALLTACGGGKETPIIPEKREISGHDFYWIEGENGLEIATEENQTTRNVVGIAKEKILNLPEQEKVPWGNTFIYSGKIDEREIGQTVKKWTTEKGILYGVEIINDGGKKNSGLVVVNADTGESMTFPQMEVKSMIGGIPGEVIRKFDRQKGEVVEVVRSGYASALGLINKDFEGFVVNVLDFEGKKRIRVMGDVEFMKARVKPDGTIKNAGEWPQDEKHYDRRALEMGGTFGMVVRNITTLTLMDKNPNLSFVLGRVNAEEQPVSISRKLDADGHCTSGEYHISRMVRALMDAVEKSPTIPEKPNALVVVRENRESGKWQIQLACLGFDDKERVKVLRRFNEPNTNDGERVLPRLEIEGGGRDIPNHRLLPLEKMGFEDEEWRVVSVLDGITLKLYWDNASKEYRWGVKITKATGQASVLSPTGKINNATCLLPKKDGVLATWSEKYPKEGEIIEVPARLSAKTDTPGPGMMDRGELLERILSNISGRIQDPVDISLSCNGWDRNLKGSREWGWILPGEEIPVFGGNGVEGQSQGLPIGFLREGDVFPIVGKTETHGWEKIIIMDNQDGHKWHILTDCNTNSFQLTKKGSWEAFWKWNNRLNDVDDPYDDDIPPRVEDENGWAPSLEERNKRQKRIIEVLNS